MHIETSQPPNSHVSSLTIKVAGGKQCDQKQVHFARCAKEPSDNMKYSGIPAEQVNGKTLQKNCLLRNLNIPNKTKRQLNEIFGEISCWFYSCNWYINELHFFHIKFVSIIHILSCFTSSELKQTRESTNLH